MQVKYTRAALRQKSEFRLEEASTSSNNGFVTMKHAVPQDFIKRLHETIAWCAPRVNISNPKHCLRSAQFRPDYEFDSKPEYDVDLGADIPMIKKVVNSRSQFLTTATPHLDLAGGRLLIHFLGESNHNGLTADITSYYQDSNGTLSVGYVGTMHLS